MKKMLAQALKIFFVPETIFPFLVGSICLSIFSSSIYDILKNTIGTSTTAITQIAIGTFSILILAAVTVYLIITRLARSPANIPFEVTTKSLDRQHRGLILLVSNEKACKTAIEFHKGKLEQCWLICSITSQPTAEKVRQAFPQICTSLPIVVNDVYDPLEFRDCINEIYERRLPRGMAESEVIADYTGMTAHGSVGTVLAILGKNRPLQYIPAKLDPDNKIIGSLDPIKVTIA
jgi:hypothetical protein